MMFAKGSFVALLTSATLIVSNSDHGHMGCGTKAVPNDQKLEDAKHMQKWITKASIRQDAAGSGICVGCINIDTYFHVFSDGLPSSDGEPTTDQLLTAEGIANQMEVLNRQFAQTPFQFTLLDTFRYTNATLANAEDGTDDDLIEREIHSRRMGGKDVANVYWYAGGCQSECGEATFPLARGIFPVNTYYTGDFVEVCPECMASDLLDPNNPTLTHEMGHWLGLYHTFEGETCDPQDPGDMVEDTPQQGKATNTTVCNATQDSCPLLPGFDPIDNFMDYSPDKCQERFSLFAGQMERMWAQWNEYRAYMPVCLSGNIAIAVNMNFGDGPLTDQSVFQINDKDDPEEFIVLITSRNIDEDYSGMLASYGACVAERHVHELFLQLRSHIITDSFYVALEIGGEEVYRTTNGDGLLYFYEEQADCGAKEMFTVEIESDTFASETSWRLLDSSGGVVVQYPFAAIKWKATFLSRHCLEPGDYTFEITDSASDGIESPGFYRINVGGQEIKRGGSFSQIESTTFTSGNTDAPTTPPTVVPSAFPTIKPSATPTTAPVKATSNPTSEAPSAFPSSSPVKTTIAPQLSPSAKPSAIQSFAPSQGNSSSPSGAPSPIPSKTPDVPQAFPTKRPTLAPMVTTSMTPSASPSATPTFTPARTTATPQISPTPQPTQNPSSVPTTKSSASPSNPPSPIPSVGTAAPEASPTTPPVESTSTPMEASFPSSAPSLIASDPSPPTIGPVAAVTLAPGTQQRATNSPTTELVFPFPRNMICFSGGTTVQVQGLGTKPMADLKIGDMVKVREGVYEPVYSFCKRLDKEAGTFLRVAVTDPSIEPLELSHNHLLFKYLDETKEPIAIKASTIQPGDGLMHIDGIKVVAQVEEVRSRGVYAPYTESGTIIVNGFHASVYAALEDEDGMNHHLLHFLQTHHRMICKTGLCHLEQYSEAGLSSISKHSLDVYNWWKSQNKAVKWLLQVQVMAGLGLLYAAEWLIQHISGFVWCILFSMWLLNRKIAKSRGKSPKELTTTE